MLLKKFKNDILDLLSIKEFNIPMLILLILTDLIFIIIHCLFTFSMNDFDYLITVDKNYLYSIENDQGYSEIFQYIKEFWILLLLLFLSFKKKHLIYFIWSLLFFYLLLDDSLSIHEEIGEYLANYFNIETRYNLRAVDFGELLVSFGVGVSFLSFLSFTYFRAVNDVRKFSVHIFILLLFLVFFGVFIDMLHTFLGDDWKLGLIEDGGEMIAMSLITAYIFNINRKT